MSHLDASHSCAEEPDGPHEEHHDHQQESVDPRVRRRDVDNAQGVDNSDEKPANDGSWHGSHATQHDDDESGREGRVADAREDAQQWCEQGAREGRDGDCCREAGSALTDHIDPHDLCPEAI